MCEVVVLFDGYSKNIDDDTMSANCTCTLIKGLRTIIVDTMTAWDREKLIDALSRHNILPQYVDYVVCTHSHADHIGNNNLFTNAEHIIGLSVNRGSTFYEKNLKSVPYQLCEGVKIIATPGHTSEDVSVLVDYNVDDEKKICAIVGDLFEKEEDIINPFIWKNLGTAELQKTHAQMRWKILQISDYIIPGHGPMFCVTNNMRQIMTNQLINEKINPNITLP